MTASKIKLSINSKIEIIENGETYRSNVQDVSDKAIVIDIPISGNKYYLLHEGLTIEFFTCIKKEFYKCRATVIAKRSQSNLQLALLSAPEVLERIQRREYFRLPISLDVKYYPLPEGRVFTQLSDVPQGYFKEMIKTFTVDLSGGGAKIVTREKLSPNRFVLINLSIPEEIFILCSVVRTETDVINKNYKVALKFISLDEKDREKIIRFIFIKSREQSKIVK
jgi:c-di-GMP-binding flagellar brake protein YcgR